MDKGGIQIGHLDRGYLPHPTTIRKVIQDWSIRRAGRSPGYMQLYRELGNELDKNYDYERMLSTSIESNGSSGSIPERISAILLFVCELGGLIFVRLGKGRRTGQNG
jgi:hypothetical protein